MVRRSLQGPPSGISGANLLERSIGPDKHPGLRTHGGAHGARAGKDAGQSGSARAAANTEVAGPDIRRDAALRSSDMDVSVLRLGGTGSHLDVGAVPASPA